MTDKNLRAIATKVLVQIIQEKKSLTHILPQALLHVSDKRDKAFTQAICFGVCRFFHSMQCILDLLLEKPLKNKDQDILILLMVGLFQLKYMQLPEYAAVTETVNATKLINKSWSKHLVNAVLRNYLRTQTFIEKKLADNEIFLFSHPAWMIARIKKDWSNDWKNILNANNQHPPFALRVNQQKISREEYLKKINISAVEISETHSGIMLNEACDVVTLPGFEEGEISVQDGAAQFANAFLKLQPQLRVLDACAAPGGKTAHILESEKNLKLVAIDADENRLKILEENLQRLQLQATCICADASKPELWWDGNLFDRILLDAPCSGSGVIRRHPDIKLLRQPTDIAKLVKQQAELLSELWKILKPGGLLLYATCSIFKAENRDVISTFLNNTADVVVEKIYNKMGLDLDIGLQILPGHFDGFYYVLLKKKRNNACVLNTTLN